MPFYEYQCRSCGHDLEAMQKISDPPLKKCPQCGKSQLQRLMSAPVFRLKGGGWYETDFKGDQDNKRNLADRPDADAPKDAGEATKDAGEGTKDGAKDSGKDAAAPSADGKGGKDGKGKDGKADVAAAKDGASKDKAADKPAAPSTTESAKKAPAGKRSARVHIPGHGKSAAKRPIKRAVHKAKRRI
jgi:putative FmdB family regulatory protein